MSGGDPLILDELADSADWSPDDVARRARLCCCGHAWIDHDPATCTGRRCACRSFHEPDARPEIHRALDR